MTDRIKQARKSANLKQYEIAELINVSRSFYSRVENGLENPSDRTLKDIARVTNTSYQWLKDGSGTMQAPTLDKDTVLVSPLLESGRDNAFYDLVLDILKIYDELTPTDKAVLEKVAKKLNEKK